MSQCLSQVLPAQQVEQGWQQAMLREQRRLVHPLTQKATTVKPWRTVQLVSFEASATCRRRRNRGHGCQAEGLHIQTAPCLGMLE